MPTKSKHSNPRWLPSLWDILICRINCILKKRSDMEIVKKLNAEQEFDHMIAFGFLPVLTSCCTFAVFSQANFFCSKGTKGWKNVSSFLEAIKDHILNWWNNFAQNVALQVSSYPFWRAHTSILWWLQEKYFENIKSVCGGLEEHRFRTNLGRWHHHLIYTLHIYTTAYSLSFSICFYHHISSAL